MTWFRAVQGRLGGPLLGAHAFRKEPQHGRWPGPWALVAPQDRHRFAWRGRVGHSGPGGDHVERITDDVRDDEADDRGRGGGPGEPSALDARQLLPHAVEFADRRTRRHQRRGSRPACRPARSAAPVPAATRSLRLRAARGRDRRPRASRRGRGSVPSRPRPSAVGSFTPAGRAAWRWMRGSRACPGTQSAGTLTHPSSRSHQGLPQQRVLHAGRHARPGLARTDYDDPRPGTRGTVAPHSSSPPVLAAIASARGGGSPRRPRRPARWSRRRRGGKGGGGSDWTM